MNLRELARGKPCMLRIPGICNYDTQTTVLAHVRMIGISAMSMKAPDWFGAWACCSCHEHVDSKGGDQYLRRLMLLEGMVRTQHEILLHHPTEAERLSTGER